MRIFLVATLSIALVACGTVGSTKIDASPKESVSFQFQDERPIDQRLTTKSKSPAGELTFLADDSIEPSGPTLLKTWLSDKFGDGIAGKNVVLLEFSVKVFEPVVAINEQGFQSAANSVPGAGVLGVLLARLLVGGIENATSDKSVGVRISGKIDNSEFSTSANGIFKGRVTESNVNSVILQALDGIVDEVKHALTKIPQQ